MTTAAERKDISKGIIVYARRWFNAGNTYHSARIVFVEDKSELVTPFVYGGGEHYWHTVGVMLGLTDPYTACGWQWRKGHGRIIDTDVIDVPRRRDMHGDGKEPKREPVKPMTPRELRQLHLQHSPDSHFFSSETMRHWGDTMRNYGVRRHEAIDTGDEDMCWELYRKHAVKNGLKASAFFARDGAKIQYGTGDKIE